MASALKISIVKHTTGLWHIRIPKRISHTGKRKSEYFKTKAQAQLRVSELTEKALALRSGEVLLSYDDLAGIQAQLHRLNEFGVSLESVIDYYIDRHRAKNEKVVDIIYRDYIDSLAGHSSDYISRVKQILFKFVESFQGESVDDVTRDRFRDWAQKLKPTPSSFNSLIRHIKPFFRWAIENGLAIHSPADGIKQLRHDPGAIEILSVDEAKALIAACRDYRADDSIAEFMRVDARGFRTIIAVMLFAGIRPKEATRLDWSAIMWEQGVIKILPEVSKTNSVRLIRIEDNLRSFLEAVPEAERIGLMGGKNFKRKWQVVRHVAGIADKNDVTRHSYASYWLALHRDTHGLLENMGHTTSKTTIKHYLTATIKSDAEEYFGIMMSSYE